MLEHNFEFKNPHAINNRAHVEVYSTVTSTLACRVTFVFFVSVTRYREKYCNKNISAKCIT